MNCGRAPTTVMTRNIRDVLPRDYGRALQRALPLGWGLERPFATPHPSATEPGPYFVDWFPGDEVWGEGWSGAPFDARGTILTPAGAGYHPVRIAQYGLHRHAAWLRDRSPASRAAFLAQAEWLRDNQVTSRGVRGTYPYAFAHPPYGALPGWLSAMAQGEAASLLLRAHAAEPGAGFGAAARAALEPMAVDVADGGVRRRTRDGDTFFEEYATDRPSYVLNGFIYALFGLWEADRYDPGAGVRPLLDAGMGTLRRRLGLYELGYWSRYDLVTPAAGPPKPASLGYHALHVAQLRALTAMTGDAHFATTAEKWRAYQESPVCCARQVASTAAALAIGRVVKPARAVVSDVVVAT